MRYSLAISSRASRLLFLLLALTACVSLTCKSTKSPVTPPNPYDANKPTIQGFTAKRGNVAITDSVVYSGEDIGLYVTAVSHALPKSCGLSEDDTVKNNLTYIFRRPRRRKSPRRKHQPGDPPSSLAIWRVPNLDQYDTGEGVLYILTVKVLDDCLGNQSSGSITLRAFANQGSPKISKTEVESKIDQTTPTVESPDPNGFYEVESGDDCSISITAESRTLPSICTNRGVAQGDELKFTWTCPDPTVILSFNSNPSLADTVEFAVPVAMNPGDKFQVSCKIDDVCTGTSITQPFDFEIIAAPEITSLVRHRE